MSGKVQSTLINKIISITGEGSNFEMWGLKFMVKLILPPSVSARAPPSHIIVLTTLTEMCVSTLYLHAALRL